MKRLLIFFSLSLLFVSFSNAQTKKAHISFKESNFDFGTIKEANGKVTHRFEFSNTGAAPLILSNVKASCGCTTPKWTNTPVPAGEKGFIDVTFNPRGYRSFTKSIRVNSNGEPPVLTLIIKGSVEPKVSSKPNYFKYDIGGLKLRNRHVAFGKINKGESQKKTIDVLNSTNKPMTVGFNSVPSNLTIKMDPAIIPPKKQARITLTYNSSNKNDWDYVFDNIFVQVNGKNYGNNNLNISAVIKEDFTKLSPQQLKKAPQVTFEPESFNFGTIKQGETVDYVFKVYNKGKSPLIIRKVRSSCGCTAVIPQDKIIKPGKSTDLKVTFNSAHKRGSQNKSITIITNDPHKDRKVLWVRGTVEVKK